MQLKMDSPDLYQYQQQALSRSIEASQRAEDERRKQAESNPIVIDPKLRSRSLNASDASELGNVLQENARDRLSDIRKTRTNLREKPNFILKLDRIVELSRQ